MERGSLPPAKSSPSHQRTGKSSSASQPQLQAGAMGLVVHTIPKAPITLQEAQSQVRGSFQNHKTNHSCFIQIRSTCSLPYPTHLSCLLAQARWWSERRGGPRRGWWSESPSHRRRRPGGILGPRNPGLSSSGQTPPVSRGLGGLRSRGTVMGQC